MIRVINGAVIITACARLQSFFSSYTFPSAEGLTDSKKLLLAVCQKILKSYKSIFVSLDCKDCKENFA